MILHGKQVYQYFIPPDVLKPLILMECMGKEDTTHTLPNITQLLIKDVETYTIIGADDPTEEEPENMVNMESFTKSYTNIYKYTKKTYTEKLGTLQNLGHIAHDIGKKKVIDTILPVLKFVANEQFYDLKLEMLKHLPEIINILNDKGEGYTKIIDTIWPVVKQLQDDGDKVTEQANLIMLKLADTLTEEDVGTHILAYILSLAHDDENNECKIKALSLLNMMAPKLGVTYCKQYVIHEVTSLASDAEHQLRKAVCQNFIKICETVGSERFHSKLFDVYKHLANDTLWSVKKAAAEVIVDISKLCSVEKKDALIDIMEGFLRDTNKWVKQSSHEQLGPFIISLPKNLVRDSLIEEFTQFCDKKKSSEEEMYQCAFYLPGVLFTMGEKSWPTLQNSYKALLSFKLPKIRDALAASLHEVFKILPSSYHSLLFEAFEQFFVVKGMLLIRFIVETASKSKFYLPIYDQRVQGGNSI